jgi:hypothetical protein
MLWRFILGFFAVLILPAQAVAQNQLLPCPPTCRDQYCEALRQKLISSNQCWQDSTTAQLQNRMSDAGYFYCTRKQQYHEAPITALQNFQRIRPPRNTDESAFDSFAVDTASRMLCP